MRYPFLAKLVILILLCRGTFAADDDDDDYWDYDCIDDDTSPGFTLTVNPVLDHIKTFVQPMVKICETKCDTFVDDVNTCAQMDAKLLAACLCQSPFTVDAQTCAICLAGKDEASGYFRALGYNNYLDSCQADLFGTLRVASSTIIVVSSPTITPAAFATAQSPQKANWLDKGSNETNTFQGVLPIETQTCVKQLANGTYQEVKCQGSSGRRKVDGLAIIGRCGIVLTAAVTVWAFLL